MKRRALPPLAIAFCLGAAMRLAFATPTWVTLAVFIASVAAALCLQSSRGALWALAAVAFSAGAFRTADWARLPGESVSRLCDHKWVRLHGVVSADPIVRPWGVSFNLNVTRADTFAGTVQASGIARVMLPREAPVIPEYGARVAILGKVRLPDDAANPGEAPPAQYLRRDGVCAVITSKAVTVDGSNTGNPIVRAAVRAHHALDRGIRATRPREEAALLAGLLFSDTGALPEDVQREFARAGTVHILSTSGLHVVLLAGILSIFLPARRPKAKRWRAAFLLCALIFFALMTGLRPAVVRAVVMTGAALAGPLFDRESDIWSAIALAAIALVATSPGNLLDPGFQLSFAAAIALALWYDGHRVVNRRRAYSTAVHLLQTSVVASLVTAPLAVRYFGTFSVASPISNILIVPFLGPAMGLGLLQGMLWTRWPAAALLLGDVNQRILHWMLWSTGRIGGAGWSAFDIGMISAAGVCASYCLLLIVWAWLRRWPREGAVARWRIPAAFSFAGVGASAYLAWLLWGPAPPLRVSFLDVGQGDCTLIQTPQGRSILVDAGGRYEADSAKASDTGKRIVLPALRRAGVRSLDVVILTHPHEDHAGGLPAVFAAIPVALWLDSGQPHAAPGYRGALEEGIRRHIPYHLGRAGQTLNIEQGVALRVLRPTRPLLVGTPDDLNNNSIVCRLEYGATSFLLCGDAADAAEAEMLSRGVGLRSDVLKVGHHGSATSSGAEFLKAVAPRWAVISCGRRNLYGHPRPETLERLREAGARVLRTDLDGGVVIESDGADLRVSTSRWQLP